MLRGYKLWTSWQKIEILFSMYTRILNSPETCKQKNKKNWSKYTYYTRCPIVIWNILVTGFWTLVGICLGSFPQVLCVQCIQFCLMDYKWTQSTEQESWSIAFYLWPLFYNPAWALSDKTSDLSGLGIYASPAKEKWKFFSSDPQPSHNFMDMITVPLWYWI